MCPTHDPQLLSELTGEASFWKWVDFQLGVRHLESVVCEGRSQPTKERRGKEESRGRGRGSAVDSRVQTGGKMQTAVGTCPQGRQSERISEPQLGLSHSRVGFVHCPPSAPAKHTTDASTLCVQVLGQVG